MTKLCRRQVLGITAITVALPATARLAIAQTYPTRPLRWIVPYAPGGTTDLVSRLLGHWLSERLGQQVIIENRPGGGTNIAVQAAINSPSDGHTLLLFGSTNAINATLYDSLPFDFLRDIVPVAGPVTLPMVIEVHPSLPIRSIEELIAFAKADPRGITMGSTGAGTTGHLAIELLKSLTGVDVVHVPYRGGAPLVTALLAGQVQAGLDALASSLPHIRSGALRALALTSRTGVLPDVPSIAESVPGYEVSPWLAFGVAKDTPPEIVARLNREINAGLASPRINAQIAEFGGVTAFSTPAALAAFVAAETEKWGNVIKGSAIKPE